MPEPYPREFRDDVVRVARNREPGVTTDSSPNDDIIQSDWSVEVAQFQSFVALIEDIEAAENLLQGIGVEPERAQSIVAKYAKQTRRLQLDIRYERQRAGLAIREQIESELLDEAASVSAQENAKVVELLLPSGAASCPLRHGPTTTANKSAVHS